MKPGTMVAFIDAGRIYFGVIAAIVRRETIEGEKKQFVISSVGSDGTANSDVTVDDSDDVADLDCWKKEDRLLALAQRLESYKWALKEMKRLDDPPLAPAPAEPAPIATDGTAAKEEF